MTAPIHNKSVVSAARVTDSLEKPALDDRSYRVILLPNQLEVLLIHDPKTDKASAALDVNVGSYSDAEDMPGLAHAVEHMLFMGTEKFPSENEYNQYLSTHNGYSNAFTAATSTNFYFEVAASAHTPSNSKASSQIDVSKTTNDSILYGALDRFAQFFVKPLFLEDTLKKELRSVDSENKKNLQSDTWRLHQLSQSVSNKKHPYNHFSTGNWKTLHDNPLSKGVDLRARFMDFYEKHYSANRMKLVVLGRESLDELESWTVELFSDVPNKNLQQNRWDDIPLFEENGSFMQLFAKPVADVRTLSFFFPYPDETDMWDCHPSHYLSHLIGHEGPGSVLAYLKEKGWADSLSCGSLPLCPGAAYFDIRVTLTAEGLIQYQEIAKVIFQYIALLREGTPQEWVFEELKNVGEVEFRFKQNSSASKTASRLSGMMQRPYPRDELLSAPVTTRVFSPAKIQEGLEYLRPDNVRITVVSQNYPGTWDKKEAWYGTEYSYQPWPKDFKKMIIDAAGARSADRPSQLHLPHKNEFIPTRLDVEKKEVLTPAIAPKLIRNDQYVRIWYKKDDQFWVPKANVKITLRTPLSSITPRCSAISKLYCSLVQDSLNEYSYDAEIAGLEYSLSQNGLGLQIIISGYNDKMAVLLEKVLHSMRELNVKEDRFDIIKERAQRVYKNWHFKQPFHQVGTYKSWLTQDRSFIVDELANELQNITVEDIRAFYPQLLKQLHIEVLAHGNLSKEDARNITDLVETILKPKGLPSAQWPMRRTLVIPPGSNYLYERTLADPENVNHCIEYVLPIGDDQDRNLRAKTLLAASIGEEPCYDQLRTKEQLGYVVFSGAVIPVTHLCYRILVQSEKSPDYLEGRIEAFLVQLGEQIRDMDENKFEKHKAGLCSKISEKPKNLKDESIQLMSYILAETFAFDSAETDVAEVMKLTKADIVDFYNSYLSPASKTRSKLSIHLLAQATPASIAAHMTPEEQLDKTVALIVQLFQSNMPVDADKLKARFAKVDLSGGDSDAVLGAVGTYLREDAGLPQEDVQGILEQGKLAIGSVLASVGIESKTETPATTDVIPVAAKATTITDVHEFRASLQASLGLRPVRDISEYEDIESKL
ncbi:LuxS/MPP-like metallohydrolase [Microthyrium microscopicum]|uniref:LuxS/MPP-like metallohydrolase n=1 Tax=Microthyrium microscopicum TaxID=703497 RepID=A0A6A6UQ89_9PEZI|nr:LuxS/MPP-like metallohydrolase [Microthyrium microscopicum]